MLSILLAIARNTFIECVRQPIYFILIALAGMAQVFTTWTAAFSMGYSDTSEVSGDDPEQVARTGPFDACLAKPADLAHLLDLLQRTPSR